MKTHLISQTILKYLSSLMFLILLIFIPAGSLDFWKGWLLVGLVFLTMLLIGILLFLYKPDLLRERLEMKEKEKEQKQIIFLSSLLFLATFIQLVQTIVSLGFKSPAKSYGVQVSFFQHPISSMLRFCEKITIYLELLMFKTSKTSFQLGFTELSDIICIQQPLACF